MTPSGAVPPGRGSRFLDTQSYEVQGLGPPCGLKAYQLRVLGQATSPLNLSNFNSDIEVTVPTCKSCHEDFMRTHVQDTGHVVGVQ